MTNDRYCSMNIVYTDDTGSHQQHTKAREPKRHTIEKAINFEILNIVCECGCVCVIDIIIVLKFMKFSCIFTDDIFL